MWGKRSRSPSAQLPVTGCLSPETAGQWPALAQAQEPGGSREDASGLIGICAGGFPRAPASVADPPREPEAFRARTASPVLGCACETPSRSGHDGPPAPLVSSVPTAGLQKNPMIRAPFPDAAPDWPARTRTQAEPENPPSGLQPSFPLGWFPGAGRTDVETQDLQGIAVRASIPEGQRRRLQLARLRGSHIRIQVDPVKKNSTEMSRGRVTR
jgi:hypothetical protein